MMSIQSQQAPGSGGQWPCKHLLTFSVWVPDLAPLLCLHAGGRSCQLTHLEEGLGHGAALTARFVWVGKRHGRYFAPWYNVCVFYSVKKGYVDGLESW